MQGEEGVLEVERTVGSSYEDGRRTCIDLFSGASGCSFERLPDVRPEAVQELLGVAEAVHLQGGLESVFRELHPRHWDAERPHGALDV